MPTASVNDELRVRQAFGWQLVQASARSFATGGNVAVAATDVGGVMVGSGHIAMQNAHYTDLTLYRPWSAHSSRMSELEARYDAVTFVPDASHWSTAIVAGLVFIVGLFGSAGVASALGRGDAPLHPLMFLAPLAVGILLGVLVTRRRQANRDQINSRSERKQLAILNQARGPPA